MRAIRWSSTIISICCSTTADCSVTTTPRRFGAVLPWPKDAPGHVLIDSMGAGAIVRSVQRRLPLRAFTPQESGGQKLRDGRSGRCRSRQHLCGGIIVPRWRSGRLGQPAESRVLNTRDWPMQYAQLLREAITQGGTTLARLRRCRWRFRVLPAGSLRVRPRRTALPHLRQPKSKACGWATGRVAGARAASVRRRWPRQRGSGRVWHADHCYR